MATISAILKAARAFFYVILVVITADCLLGLGLFELSLETTRSIIGLALLAILMLAFRISLLQQRQAILARRLIQLSPDARNVEAVKILIGALGSDQKEIRDNVLEELRRLTGEDYGEDAAAWKHWVRRKERGESVESKPGE